MEDAPIPGLSVLQLVCSVLAGSPECAGGQADQASCDQMQGAFVYVMRPTEAAEQAALEQALAVMTRRLQGPDLCSLEAALTGDGGMTLRIVSLDPEPVDAAMLAPGVLDFYEVDHTLAPGQIAPGFAVFPDRTGAPVTVKWDSLLPADPVAEASAREANHGWVIDVVLTPEAGQAFADVTTALGGKELAIVVDDVVLMYPRIMEPIMGGALQISANFNRAEAEALAAMLNAGSLPDGLELEITTLATEPWSAPRP